jgi:hypothetical protein
VVEIIQVKSQDNDHQHIMIQDQEEIKKDEHFVTFGPINNEDVANQENKEIY